MTAAAQSANPCIGPADAGRSCGMTISQRKVGLHAGVPSGKMFARPNNPIKAGGHSSGSLPFSMMEPSQDGLSNSKRSTSDRLSLGRLSGSQGQQSPFQLVEPVREAEQQ